ncbi:MAG: HAD family hydrolase [Bacilli bacterium]
MNKIKLIIFDMDGVLVKSEQFYHERRKRFLIANNYYENLDLNLTGLNEKEVWNKMVPDDTALRDKLLNEYREYRKINQLPIKKLYDKDALPLFLYLKSKNYKIAIASSSDINSIENFINVSQTRHLVDFYISGEQCSKYKPDPEIYNKVLEKFNLTSDEAVAVEDSYQGIEAAKRAGLYVYGISTTNIDQSKANLIIKKIISLKEQM